MNINLHIERLVLDGFSVERRDSRALRRSVEEEFTRLLAANGLSSELRSGGSLHAVQGGKFTLQNHGRNAVTLGHDIAYAIYAGIGM